MSEKRVRATGTLLIVCAFSVAAWLWTRDGRRHSNRAATGTKTDGLAHELNNYLGAIRGYCEVAKMTHPDDANLVKGMDAAMESATEAALLVDQLRNQAGI